MTKQCCHGLYSFICVAIKPSICGRFSFFFFLFCPSVITMLCCLWFCACWNIQLNIYITRISPFRLQTLLSRLQSLCKQCFPFFYFTGTDAAAAATAAVYLMLIQHPFSQRLTEIALIVLLCCCLLVRSIIFLNENLENGHKNRKPIGYWSMSQNWMKNKTPI